jgi:glycosyltransferase involved in cell wall biosynthesis
MEKLKVIHMVEDLKIGGLERIIASIVKNLDRTRYETKVWCLAEGGQIAEEIIEKGVEVKTLGMRSYYNLINIIILSWLLKKEKVTILHTHGYFASTFGRLAAILIRLPVVITHIHSTYYIYSRRNLIIERFLSQFTDAIVCISQAVKKFVTDFEDIQGNKVHVIYNGVETPDLSEGKLDRVSFNISGDDIVAITVASLAPHKGHKVLIDAMKIVSSDCRRLRLLIVGDGPLRNDLLSYTEELQLSSLILFAGQRTDVYSLLRLSDVFVLPSLEREGLGIALIEAMASGLPVIGTRLGGIPEVIEEGVTGLLCVPGDSIELADAMKKLISDSTLREKMGHAGRKIYEEKFTVEGMIRNIESLYEKLVEHNAGKKDA